MTYELQDGLSQQELQQYWQVWWNEVTQRRNHGDFVRYPELQLLSQVTGTTHATHTKLYTHYSTHAILHMLYSYLCVS